MSFDVKTRLSKLKNSAKSRGLNVNLDVNKYQNLIDQGCYFCDADLTNEGGYCLDRVDSTKGYTIMNVLPCCKICNRAKSDLDAMDFTNWVIKAGKNMQKRVEEVQRLMSLGVTQEMYERVTLELSNQDVKFKEKIRIKYNPYQDKTE